MNTAALRERLANPGQIHQPNRLTYHTLGLDTQQPVYNVHHEDIFVDFVGDADPANPQNWSAKHKVVLTLIVIVHTIIPISMITIPGADQHVIELAAARRSGGVLTKLLSAYGHACAFDLVPDLSELHGRRNMTVLITLGFVMSSIALAFSSEPSAYTFAGILAAFFASALTRIGSIVLSDIHSKRTRNLAIGLHWIVRSCSPSLGAMLRVVLDRYWGDSRWELVPCMLGLIGAVLSLYVQRESCASVILEIRASRIRRDTCNWIIQARMKGPRPRTEGVLRPGNMSRPYLLIMEGLFSLIVMHVPYVLIIALRRALVGADKRVQPLPHTRHPAFASP
jgi:MFS family permease